MHHTRTQNIHMTRDLLIHIQIAPFLIYFLLCLSLTFSIRTFRRHRHVLIQNFTIYLVCCSLDRREEYELFYIWMIDEVIKDLHCQININFEINTSFCLILRIMCFTSKMNYSIYIR